MYAFSLPKFDLFPLAFVFLVPLLYALETQKVKNAFWLFFRFSFFSYLLLLYWIPNVMVQYGNMGKGLSLAAFVMLPAFLALFTGVVGSLIKKILQRQNNLLSLLMIPFTWVSRELVVEHILSGFPWCSPGYSQYRNFYFAQTAEIGGIHLLTFMVIYFNVLLYLLLKRREIRIRLAAVLLISVVGMYTTGYFLYRMNESSIGDQAFHTAGILQPNTQNDDAFNWNQKNKKLDEFFNDSKALMDKGAEFVIWPEYTIYIYPLQNKFHYRCFQEFVKDHVPVLAGFTDVKSSSELYNSVMLFHKNDKEFQKYDKVHLTPFGEYIPFRKLFFFVDKITQEIGEFTPGKEVRNIELEGRRLATPICYELIFPGLIREFIAKGGEVIVIASNDSWYGDTSAPYQLLCMSVIRSIENRRYILRSTTNGISALIAPSGEILYQSPFNAKDTFTAKFKYLEGRTIFTRFGYLFPYFCVLLLLLYFTARLTKIMKGKTK